MRLLYITNGINGSGGLERVLSVKASLLAEKYAIDLGIIVLNQSHLHPFYEFSDKIQMISISVGGNPLAYFQSYRKGIQKAVQDFQPDIISVCDDGLKGFFLPKMIKTTAKWIYERHASIELNTNLGLKGKVVKYLMQKQIRFFDTFVVLTSSNLKEWQANNMVVIPNPASFQTAEHSSLETKQVIVVGSHSYNKGFDTLLKIWKEVENIHTDWKLKILGKIDENKTYLKLAEQLRLENVDFHPPVKDIKEEYLGSSIMLLTSRSEGFGMVLIEAMECGVPCISFDCPSGPRDIISHKHDGFLIEDQNRQEFTETLAMLIENETLRKQMGKNAKKNAQRFSPDIIVNQWHHLFTELRPLQDMQQ